MIISSDLVSLSLFNISSLRSTSKFVITKVVSRGTPGAYKIIGNLNLKAATKELRFNADIKTIEGKQTAVAKIKLDRSDSGTTNWYLMSPFFSFEQR